MKIRFGGLLINMDGTFGLKNDKTVCTDKVNDFMSGNQSASRTKWQDLMALWNQIIYYLLH